MDQPSAAGSFILYSVHETFSCHRHFHFWRSGFDGIVHDDHFRHRFCFDGFTQDFRRTRLPWCMKPRLRWRRIETVCRLTGKRSATAGFSSLVRPSSRIFRPSVELFAATQQHTSSRPSVWDADVFLSGKFSFLRFPGLSAAVRIDDIFVTDRVHPAGCFASKHRITWMIASTSRILARNLLPSPSPLLAPRTSPAMSTISIWVGTAVGKYEFSQFLQSRIRHVHQAHIGSMVQNGSYFRPAPLALLLTALKSVDLPTSGRPTMPACNPMNDKLS